MARVCSVCGKGVAFGNRVSHSNMKTRRRWEPNLKTVHRVVDGHRTAMRVCTRCIRSGKVGTAGS
jgi:large subunit ribosomal protein L28